MRLSPLLLALLFFSASGLNARVFTDLKGRTFEGELVASTGSSVQIKRLGDQQVFSIPLATLSPQDRAYIAQFKSAQIAGPADAAIRNYRLGKFTITTADAKPQELQLRIRYNNRDVWTGAANARDAVDLHIGADTDFNEEPRKGYAKSDNIYLYIESKDYAPQWHLLERAGNSLGLQDTGPIKLHRQKYVIIEYAFYAGDETNFAGREPLRVGVAAVGHWGKLPGFSHDWQVWQGSEKPGSLWGDTPLLQFHRGTSENGLVKASATRFDQLKKAPTSGYIHYGACGAPKLAARAGDYFYCRIVGHTESTRGYGKIHIREITETVPQGIEVLTR